MQTDCNALNAYLFYEDAQCSGAKSIRGSLVYEYDDSTGMETDGFVIDAYNGPCNYFEGGYHDFLNDSDETDSDMTQGFCITCDGVVGCSASEDSCDEFYTISAADDTDYAEANAQDQFEDLWPDRRTGSCPAPPGPRAITRVSEAAHRGGRSGASTRRPRRKA